VLLNRRVVTCSETANRHCKRFSKFCRIGNHSLCRFFNLRKEAQRRASSDTPSTLSDAEVKRSAVEHWLTSQDDGATVKAALAFGVTLPEISEAVANEFYKHQEAALDDEAVA
jgi:hypothetical protein